MAAQTVLGGYKLRTPPDLTGAYQLQGSTVLGAAQPRSSASDTTGSTTTTTPTSGPYGGYASLNDFITANWKIGYGDKPVDVQQWTKYINEKPGDNYKPGDPSTIDYAYWSQRLQGWQAGGSDAPTQGPFAASGTGSGSGGSTLPTGPNGAPPPHGDNPNNQPSTGTAVRRGSQITNGYVDARAAASKVRQQARNMGRSSTILGGFNTGTPITRPATLLGGGY